MNLIVNDKVFPNVFLAVFVIEEADDAMIISKAVRIGVVDNPAAVSIELLEPIRNVLHDLVTLGIGSE